MIPAIGIMIGFYIFTKMFYLTTKLEGDEDYKRVRIMAVITMVVAVIGVLAMFRLGDQVADIQHRLELIR